MTFFVTSVGMGKGADLADWPAPTGIVKNLPRRSAREARPGMLTCPRKAPLQQMRAIASAKVLG